MDLIFVAFGMLLAGFVALIAWVAQWRRWGLVWNLALLLVAAAALSVIVFLTWPVATLAKPRDWRSVTPIRELTLFVVMIVGMAARYMTRAIELRREKIVELSKNTGRGRGRKPRLEFDFWEFSYPLFVSIVTFGALLAQIENSAITLANTILSFQTGFFWQTVLARRDASGQ